ncbi:MAG TPA: hypothetical protein RMF84_19755, partial [Polyangiaceae bacterium LLY-WYZ-14_1]|nr:hypothetical protein [Polyangiaceae bacterium LLY-WYZ-14_1]
MEVLLGDLEAAEADQGTDLDAEPTQHRSSPGTTPSPPAAPPPLPEEAPHAAGGDGRGPSAGPEDGVTGDDVDELLAEITGELE